MFDTLSDRLSSIFTSLRGKGRLTEEDINSTLREIRIALLEADVALVAVKSFTAKVRERALGADIHQALNPAQQVIKIVNDELVAILGGETRQLTFAKTPPTVIMLAGLQGTGKTTLAGKLGLWLKNNGHAPLLVAADLQRPNAVQQLQVVGGQAGVDVFAPEPGNGVGDPVSVARQSIEHARRIGHDVVVVDTAGRLGIDQDMMRQAASIRDAVQPDEILFVVDAMIGQDAVNTAQAFADGVGFTGVVLTKLDGDARGGAALSVVEVTGQQILFASSGEKLADFDVFHPDRMVSRILGMGDMMTLIEQAQRSFDAGQAEEMADKFAAGEDFTLEDFLQQMQTLRKMGPLANILGMLPGASQMKEQIDNIDERDLDRVAAIIHSMTPQERREPKILNASRRARIARGAGVTVTDVNGMVDRFFAAQKMMKQMAGGMGLPGAMMRRSAAKNAKAKKKKGGARVSGRPGATLPAKTSGTSTPPALPGGAFPGPGGDSAFGPGSLPKGLEGFDLSKLKLPPQK